MLLLALTSKLSAQTAIGGTVNSYDTLLTRGSGACGDSIVVAGLMNYSVGDLLLFYNPKGANYDTSFSVNFGDSLSLGGAGRYDLAFVSSAASPLLQIDRQLNGPFSTGTMVIKVPVYQYAELSSNITAPAYSNGTGGIVAISARKLKLSADINVNAKGLVGGNSSRNMGFGCGVVSYRNPGGTNAGAPKGEGIGDLPNRMANGRGHFLNGGGGGNNHNAGGGGGANAGSGGQGGDEWGGCSPVASIGGLGGQATLNTSVTRVFFGGGGGSGHNNVSNLSSEGGRGGGLVFLFCDTIEANGGQIRLNGEQGKTITNGAEGAGGGGAGGNVVLASSTVIGNLSITAIGGDGGDCTGGTAGPGGGGGGGKVWFGTGTASNLTLSLNGGAAGNLAAASNNYGSTAGAAGNSSAFNVTGRPQSQTGGSLPSNFLGRDTTICFYDTLILRAPGGYTYLWSDGSTADTLLVSGAGVYSVQLGTGPCATIDSIRVQNFPGGVGNFLGPDLILCENASLSLSTSIVGNYIWSTGATSNSIVVNQPGWYWLNVQVGAACPVRDSIFVSLDDFSTTARGIDTTVCSNESFFLEYPQGWIGFWPDGSFGRFFNFRDPGLFIYEVQNENGCVRFDTLNLQLLGTDSIVELFSFSDTTVCAQEGLRVDFSTLNGDLFWSDGRRSKIRTLYRNQRYLLRYEEDCLSTIDTLDLTVINCDTCALYFPNAFSPNGDGLNDFFLLQSQCNFDSYQISISDRWGEQVFFSQDALQAWNGTFKGSDCSQGIYIYDVRYQLPLQGERREQGYLFLKH